MKLKKLKKSNYISLKLQILKLSYKKNQYNQDILLKSTEILLNKIANIIFRYSSANKRILFIGFPNDFNTILAGSKHLAIPEFMLFNGILQNNDSILSNKNNKLRVPKNIFKLTLKLKNKADLIITHNITNELILLKEAYLNTIPVITLNSTWDILNNKAAYESTGNYHFCFEKKENQQFLFSLMRTLIIKSNKYKKIQSTNFSEGFYKKHVVLK